jgi:CheY-like chemotaxis protein
MAVADIFGGPDRQGSSPYKKPCPCPRRSRSSIHEEGQARGLRRPWTTCSCASGRFQEYASDSSRQYDAWTRPRTQAAPGAPGPGPRARRRENLKALFAGWGAEVVENASGVECLKDLAGAFRAGHPFRIALLDASLEDMDGFTVAGELGRSERGFPRHSIVLTTDRHAPGDASRAVEAGTAGYLVRRGQARSELVFAILESRPGRGLHAGVRSRDLRGNCPRSRLLPGDDIGQYPDAREYYLEGLGFRHRLCGERPPGRGPVVAKEYDLVIAHGPANMDGYEMVRTIPRWGKAQRGEAHPILPWSTNSCRRRARGLEAGARPVWSSPSQSPVIDLVESIYRAQGGVARRSRTWPPRRQHPGRAPRARPGMGPRSVGGDSSGCLRLRRCSLTASAAGVPPRPVRHFFTSDS